MFFLICHVCFTYLSMLQLLKYQKLPQICSTNFGSDFGSFGTLWCGSVRVCPIKTSPDTFYNFPNLYLHILLLLCVCTPPPTWVYVHPLNLSGDSNWLLVFPSQLLPLIRDRQLDPYSYLSTHSYISTPIHVCGWWCIEWVLFWIVWNSGQNVGQGLNCRGASRAVTIVNTSGPADEYIVHTYNNPPFSARSGWVSIVFISAQ